MVTLTQRLNLKNALLDVLKNSTPSKVAEVINDSLLSIASEEADDSDLLADAMMMLEEYQNAPFALADKQAKKAGLL